ncbi:MAG: hypothetical protein ABEJ58_10940 [Halodesulfurarchaeum sp.]
MHGTGSVKVPDGKLVEVELMYDEVIQSVRITGDFFLEPPDARTALESAIEGHHTDANESELREAIERVDADLIGFDANHLVAATREALR